MNDVQIIIGILLYSIVLVIYAILHAFDRALFYLSEHIILKQKEEGSKKASRLYKILEKQAAFHDTKETFQVLGIGVFCVYGIYESELICRGTQSIFISLFLWCVALLILMIFGILIPGRIGKLYSNQVGLFLGGTIRLLEMVLKPFTLLGVGLSHGVLRIFGIDGNAEPDHVSEEEIMTLVNEGQELGVLEPEEAEMITKIFALGDKSAGDIMTHRSSVVAMEAGMTLEEFIQTQLDGNYSRFPIYQDDINNVIGTVHIRDALVLYRNIPYRKKPIKELHSLLRPPYFIPETRDIDDLLRDMQAQKIHMGIVVDEYGQTAGVLSMEDIIEEIVGNILDEYDEEEELIEQNDEDTYIVDGLTELEDLNELLNVTIISEEYETLNGFLISILDRIPYEDESCEIHAYGYTFKVLEVAGNVIRKVEITRYKEINIESDGKNTETE